MGFQGPATVKAFLFLLPYYCLLRRDKVQKCVTFPNARTADLEGARQNRIHKNPN
jgi:hypothetical protein